MIGKLGGLEKHDWQRPDEEMDEHQKSCPKCGLEFNTLLHRHCKHADCPVRVFKAMQQS